MPTMTGVTRDERLQKMAKMLREAGKTGLTGAAICEKLGITPGSPQEDEAAHDFSRLPTYAVRKGEHLVYFWKG